MKTRQRRVLWCLATGFSVLGGAMSVFGWPFMGEWADLRPVWDIMGLAGVVGVVVLQVGAEKRRRTGTVDVRTADPVAPELATAMRDPAQSGVTRGVSGPRRSYLTRTDMRLVPLPLLVIGVGTMMGGHSEWSELTNGVEVDAVVTHVSGRTAKTEVVRFATADGRQFTASVRAPGEQREGDRIRVIHSPHDPRMVVAEGESYGEKFWGGWGLLGVSLSVTLYAWAFMGENTVIGRKPSRRKAR